MLFYLCGQREKPDAICRFGEYCDNLRSSWGVLFSVTDL